MFFRPFDDIVNWVFLRWTNKIREYAESPICKWGPLNVWREGEMPYSIQYRKLRNIKIKQYANKMQIQSENANPHNADDSTWDKDYKTISEWRNLKSQNIKHQRATYLKNLGEKFINLMVHQKFLQLHWNKNFSQKAPSAIVEPKYIQQFISYITFCSFFLPSIYPVLSRGLRFCQAYVGSSLIRLLG